MMRTVKTLLAFLTIAMTSASAQASILLTMDDLPFQTVDGLVHPSGVTFGFTVGGTPDLDANYNSGAPGLIFTFVSDPSIEGTTLGILEILTPGMCTIVQFGLAVSSGGLESVNVELFDASNVSLGVQSLALTPLISFSEGQFSYSGTGISRIIVDMTPATGAGRFAFDNLLLDTTTAVPEPGTMTLVGMGAFGLVVGAIRRRRQKVA